MNAQQEELFDLAILRVLEANKTRYGLTAGAISALTVQFGFANPKTDDVLDRIEQLIKVEFVEEVSKVHGKANRAWRITEPGLQHVYNKI